MNCPSLKEPVAGTYSFSVLAKDSTLGQTSFAKSGEFTIAQTKDILLNITTGSGIEVKSDTPTDITVHVDSSVSSITIDITKERLQWIVYSVEAGEATGTETKVSDEKLTYSVDLSKLTSSNPVKLVLKACSMNMGYIKYHVNILRN